MSSLTNSRRLAGLLAALAAVLCFPSDVRCEEPQKVTVCELKADPAAYNHRLVQVTGFVTHGFEDFSLNDPSCPAWPSVWLEYGGKANSGTIYCCGGSTARSRPEELLVENVPVSLVDDRVFREFDRLIQMAPSSGVHATILGRFFSGEQIKQATGSSGGGYGHLGCCSLLAIERIQSVDAHNRNDLDYITNADEPDINWKRCGSETLVAHLEYQEILEAQKEAESGGREWSFEDYRRVASEALARLANVDEQATRNMKTLREGPGRITYVWKPRKSRLTYMLQVSRPYWLSYYSRDPKRVPWILIAASRSGCGKDNPNPPLLNH